LRVGTRLGKLTIVRHRCRSWWNGEGLYVVRCACGHHFDAPGPRLRGLELASCGRCDRDREQRLLDVAQELRVAPAAVRRYLVDPSLVPRSIRLVFAAVDADLRRCRA
jgi:hypothetical protein